MFTTPKGLFKLTVMFFELTNLPVTFQMIINEILWDSINSGEVVSFIDDVIVVTEKEEKHGKVVEEIMKRLAENNFVYEAKEV